MKVNPDIEYGWRLSETGPFFSYGPGDPWYTIGCAVSSADDDDKLAEILVGEVEEWKVRDLIDSEDIYCLYQDESLTPDGLLELIGERHWENVYEGGSEFIGGDGAIKSAAAEFQKLIEAVPEKDGGLAVAASADRFIEWAEKHIRPNPPQSCGGIYPLPVEYVEGEWHFGREEEEPPASIFISYEFNEKGEGCWQWETRGGVSGVCEHLGDAVKASEAQIQKEEGNESKP